MLRSIPIILALLSEVGVTGPRAKTYAPVLQELGVKYHLDPATLISIVKGESGWRESIVNSLGCVGLGQICLSNYVVCQDGNRGSAACQEKRAQLQDGVHNLRVMAAAIKRNREFCNKKTGKHTKSSRSRWRHWLPSYGGYNKPKQGIWCGQKRVKTKRGYRWQDVAIPKRIVQYMKLRSRIIRTVSCQVRKRK